MCFILPLVTLSLRCEDYILIDRGASGTEEICGNMSSGPSTDLENSFRVLFRTSEFGQGAGFSMLVVCFDLAALGKVTARTASS